MLGDPNLERGKPSQYHIGNDPHRKAIPNQPKCHMKLGHTFLTWFPPLLSPKVRVCGVSRPTSYQMTKERR